MDYIQAFVGKTFHPSLLVPIATLTNEVDYSHVGRMQACIKHDYNIAFVNFGR